MALPICPDCGHRYRNVEQHKHGAMRTCTLNQARQIVEDRQREMRSRGWSPLSVWGATVGKADVPMIWVPQEGYVHGSTSRPAFHYSWWAPRWAVAIAEMGAQRYRLGLTSAARVEYINRLADHPEMAKAFMAYLLLEPASPIMADRLSFLWGVLSV